MSNLPNWAGSATVYNRAEQICQHLNSKRYAQCCELSKGKKKIKFYPDDDATAIIDAMNKGNEEALKAFCHQYRNVWL